MNINYMFFIFLSLFVMVAFFLFKVMNWYSYLVALEENIHDKEENIQNIVHLQYKTIENLIFILREYDIEASESLEEKMKSYKNVQNNALVDHNQAYCYEFLEELHSSVGRHEAFNKSSLYRKEKEFLKSLDNQLKTSILERNVMIDDYEMLGNRFSNSSMNNILV